MALSNIFREPQREITESVVGLVVFGALMGGDYLFLRWFERATVVYLTHALGETICDFLENHNIHLRPRNRR